MPSNLFIKNKHTAGIKHPKSLGIHGAVGQKLKVHFVAFAYERRHGPTCAELHNAARRHFRNDKPVIGWITWVGRLWPEVKVHEVEGDDLKRRRTMKFLLKDGILFWAKEGRIRSRVSLIAFYINLTKKMCVYSFQKKYRFLLVRFITRSCKYKQLQSF